MKSKIDTSWDVMKYKYHYELEHQWDLKKRFIQAHKDKYPEARLICLAQLYCNVHFMGCSYDESIMKLIEELSEGIAEKNAKWQKQTFVAASSAVEARVKDRLGRTMTDTEAEANVVVKVETEAEANVIVKVEDCWPYETKVEANVNIKVEGCPINEFWQNPQEDVFRNTFSADVNTRRCILQSKFLSFISRCIYPHDYEGRPWECSSKTNYVAPDNQIQTVISQVKINEEQHPRKKRKLQPIEVAEPEYVRSNWQKHECLSEELAKQEIETALRNSSFACLVIMENLNRKKFLPWLIIQESCRASEVCICVSYQNKGGLQIRGSKIRKCNLHLDGMLLSSGLGQGQKQARDAACKIAIERLKETSFTIQVKASFTQEGDEVGRSLETDQQGPSTGVNQPITDDNIGNKMMKLMGWGGGGLGKNKQGIEEPISAKGTVRREGLGLYEGNFNTKIQELLRNFSNGPSKDDLVFSTDFNKDERKTIHQMVRKYNLKSRSYGNDDNRRLVVFKKFKPLEIVEDLLMAGCETTKYRLLPPKSLIDRFTV